MRIQYASDLHLDLRPAKFRQVITPSADILVLAGNIGHPFRKTFKLFLRWCVDKFEYVLFVPGNQEYHGSSLKAARKKMKDICKIVGAIFLDKKAFIIEDEIVILGCTLWSYIPSDKSFGVLYTIDDYKSIRDFDLNANNALYLHSKQWLEEKIMSIQRQYPNYQMIVVTHHAPILGITSPPDCRRSTNLCAYASDCSNILKLGVDAWIFGHTHYNATFKYHETIVTSNQRGIGYQKNRILTYEK